MEEQLKEVYYLNGIMVYKTKIEAVIGKKKTAQLIDLAKRNYNLRGNEVTTITLRNKAQVSVKIKKIGE